MSKIEDAARKVAGRLRSTYGAKLADGTELRPDLQALLDAVDEDDARIATATAIRECYRQTLKRLLGRYLAHPSEDFMFTVDRFEDEKETVVPFRYIDGCGAWVSAKFFVPERFLKGE